VILSVWSAPAAANLAAALTVAESAVVRFAVVSLSHRLTVE
jgi:hypothetical protein